MCGAGQRSAVIAGASRRLRIFLFASTEGADPRVAVVTYVRHTARISGGEPNYSELHVPRESMALIKKTDFKSAIERSPDRPDRAEGPAFASISLCKNGQQFLLFATPDNWR